MYGVELYAAVRLAVVEEGLSHREAARRFGIDRRTVKKMLSYSAPPGYRRTKPVRRPKLEGFTGIIDAILEADADPAVPRKQRHTAHRIFERLRDEHGFTGGYTIVKDYVRARRQTTREAFVPLHHPPGHAQVDFGEAVVEVGGLREKVAFFCLILPHSDVWFVKAYPKETTEAFLDGHVSAFAFLGGVPRSILYDNTTLAVARILGDGTRRRTQAFTHLQSHYLFRDRFGRPGKGNDKGKVEALVKTARRTFMVPIPKVPDLDVLNERLMAHVLAAERLHGDDTPVPVLASGKTDTGRAWVYVRDDKPFAGPGPPATLFRYSRDRSGDHPVEHLRTFAGILQVDAYAGYRRLYEPGRSPGPVTEALCWSHGRRKFYELADIAAGKRRGKSTPPWPRRWTTC